MAHYRKIDTRILLDQKFNQLSSDARLVFLHLLIHPNLTSLGAMHASMPSIACELNWSIDCLQGAIQEICQQGMVKVDEAARFVWFPNFLKYNAPESPNVVKSWETAFSYLPECALQKQLIRKINAFVGGLGQAFQEALPACFHLNEGLEVEFRSDQRSLLEGVTENPDSLSEGFLEKAVPLSKGVEENPLPLSEGFSKNEAPLSKPLSIKHKALSIEHRALSIKQETKEIVLENDSEEKPEIGEITNIVALTRRKATTKPPDAEVLEVFKCWQRIMGHPQAQLEVKRRKIIGSALASGYTVAQLCEAIKGCSQTPHNIGQNEQGQRYDGLHVIFRDADQIDRFIHNAHSPPRLQNAADRLLATNLAATQRWLASQQEERVCN